jgi:hypothetical protein
MPLTTYTAGEVLTAASLNDNFTFAAANPPGGLTLISTTTIGTTVSSVTVSGAFSSTYDNYRVIISGTGVASTSNGLSLTFGATASGYSRAGISISTNSTTVIGVAQESQTSIPSVGLGSTTNLSLCMDVFNPFIATRTVVNSFGMRSIPSGALNLIAGYLDNTTSYTAFTLTTTTGTITGGHYSCLRIHKQLGK